MDVAAAVEPEAAGVAVGAALADVEAWLDLTSCTRIIIIIINIIFGAVF